MTDDAAHIGAIKAELTEAPGSTQRVASDRGKRTRTKSPHRSCPRRAAGL
jgi:hypothetical protein